MHVGYTYIYQEPNSFEIYVCTDVDAVDYKYYISTILSSQAITCTCVSFKSDFYRYSKRICDQPLTAADIETSYPEYLLWN